MNKYKQSFSYSPRYILHSPLCRIKSRFFCIRVFLRVPSGGGWRRPCPDSEPPTVPLPKVICRERLALNRLLCPASPSQLLWLFTTERQPSAILNCALSPNEGMTWECISPERESLESLSKKHWQGSAFFHPGQIPGKSLPWTMTILELEVTREVVEELVVR